jgi:hypothetical protein
MVPSDDPERHDEVWWPYHPPADLEHWQKRLIERRSLFDGGELIAGIRDDQIEHALTKLVRGVPSSLPGHGDLGDWRKWLLDASAQLKREQPVLTQRKSSWIRRDQALDDIDRIAEAYRAGDSTIPARLERHYADLEEIDWQARTHYARLDEYRVQWLRFASAAEAWLDHDFPWRNRGMSSEPDWLGPAEANVGLLKHWTEVLRQRSDDRSSLSADVADYNESRRHWRFAILFGQ